MSDAPRLVANARLGPFRLIDKIALGGMAEIWSAELEEERFALKVLQPPFSRDQSFRMMFQDEVNIATRLQHANIVRVFGVHEVEDVLFQAMELIEGKDLRRVLSGLARAGQWFPIRHALYVGQQLSRALGYAHQRRGEDGRGLEIVHRDVSPHNVMLDVKGRVKLLDFGIARAAERLAKTRPGVVKGKIPYMAPEQALAVGVTPSTDIFATGVLLWEMMAMRRLFRGANDAELLEKVVRAEVPPLQSQNEKVPDDVAELVHKMLQQRAPDRPPTMETVENALTRMIARHFGEVTAASFAEWSAPFVEETKKEITMALAGNDPTEPTPHVGGDPTEPNPVPDLSEEAADAFEDAMASWESVSVEISDESGQTLAVEMPPPGAAVTPTPTPVDPSQAITPDITPDEMPDTPDDGGTERVRMPTKSEIIRAVDNVKTVPIQADPNFVPPQQVKVESVPVEVPIVDEPAGDTADLDGPIAIPGDLTPPELQKPMIPTKTIERREVPASSAPTEEGPHPGRPASRVLPMITIALSVVVVLLLIILITGR